MFSFTDSQMQKSTFLVDIGAKICRQKDEKGEHVLSLIQDKVVQDIDGSEGTGLWSQQEAVRTHVPAPTLTAARKRSHFMFMSIIFTDKT